MSPLSKLTLYLQAARASRSANLRGCPTLPKASSTAIPRSRVQFNTFILWISKLASRSTSTLMDVGANCGDFSRAASTLFPKARVFLAEPLPSLHPGLEAARMSHFPNWTLLPYALGARQEVLPFHIDESQDQIGSFKGFSGDYLRANPEAHESASLPMEVHTLDEVVEKHAIQHIDLLKIDVEGFEVEVLAGARRSLTMTQAVIVEVSLVRNVACAMHPLVDMLERLTRAGFEIVEVIPSLYDRELTWKPCEFNVLARRGRASSR